MCTIVFIPTSGTDFLLAHNRDESPKRAKASGPEPFSVHNRTVLAPIDGSQKGSWIYTNDAQTVFLFNGAYEKHSHRPPYDRSRGKIVLETLEYFSHESFLENVDLSDVEPFTQIMIAHDNGEKEIRELIWDGSVKTVRKLEWAPFIRSSCTLYNAEVQLKKQRQFDLWLAENEAEDILSFMQNTEYEVPTILRHPLVETISTTIVTRKNGENGMAYWDYL